MGIVHIKERPGFVSFQAKYDKGASLDAQPEEDDRDVPPPEKAAIAEIAAELGLRPGRPAREAMKKVETFFRDKFQYSTWLGPEHRAGTNETPLAKFLLKNRKGHCEYF